MTQAHQLWAAARPFLLLIPVAALLALFFHTAVQTAARFIAREGWYRVLYRLMTGHHLDGHDRNNRSWRHPGTRVVNRERFRHQTWLSRRSRQSRALAFWIPVTLACYTVVGWFTGRAVTVILWKVSAAILILAAIFRALRWLARRHHRTTVVRPLATQMSGHLNVSAPVAAELLKVRPNLDAVQPGQEVAKVRLPDTYTAQPSEQEFMQNLLAARIPCELSFKWETHRHPMRLVALCASAPPLAVPLAAHLPQIEALSFGQYLLGVSADGQPEVWDANEEDPHAMIGNRTRGGKTNVMLGIAGQALRRGERVTYIDPKRVSAECLVGVPGFTLANDPRNVQGMWDTIHRFRDEMDAAINGEGDGRPHTLMIDEIPVAFGMFRAYWEQVKDPGQRVTDVPAWLDVKAVLYQGAQFGYRVVVGAQDLTQEVLFRSRPMFGTILMGGCTPAQWRYAVGTLPVPPSPTRKGRFYLVRGHDHALMQAVIAHPKGREHNEQAWREFALNGRAPGHGTVYERSERVFRPRLALPWRTPQPAAISPLLIGPAAAAAYLGMSQKAFESARRRMPDSKIPGEFQDYIRGKRPGRGRLTTCWPKETLDLWGAKHHASV